MVLVNSQEAVHHVEGLDISQFNIRAMLPPAITIGATRHASSCFKY